jgi:ligand-binding sensor domain-containing protein
MSHLNFLAVAVTHAFDDAFSQVAAVSYMLKKLGVCSQAQSHACNLVAAHAHELSCTHIQARRVTCIQYASIRMHNIQRTRQAHGPQLWLRPTQLVQPAHAKRVHVRNEVAVAPGVSRQFSACERTPISESRPLPAPVYEIVRVVGLGRRDRCGSAAAS